MALMSRRMNKLAKNTNEKVVLVGEYLYVK